MMKNAVKASVWKGADVEPKLSKQQKQILEYLLQAHVRAEEAARYWNLHPRDLPVSSPDVFIWGVLWQTQMFMPLASVAQSRKRSLIVSKSLARLEQRGLVIRQNRVSGTAEGREARTTSDSVPPKRSTHVLLTMRGRIVAQAVMRKRIDAIYDVPKLCGGRRRLGV